MADRIKDIIVGVVLAILAYLKPIEGELSSLMIVFVLNFVFGYLSGMIAKGENFELKKAVVCIGHATVFFVLCAAIYVIGRLKGQMEGSVQCVSFISYLVLWFYGCNILKNLKQIFKKGTPPWYVVSFLYYLMRFKFIEKIPYLSDYLNYEEKEGKV
nr:MAG TPA: hypothetical protein [Bacteriophage sp.]